MLTRRELLNVVARAAPAAGCAGLVGASPLGPWLSGAARLDDAVAAAPKARYWVSVAQAAGNCTACHTPGPLPRGKRGAHDPGLVRCLLCAQGCGIRPGQRGKCRVRANVDGELRSLVYGRPLAVHLDPIEKKPFYHFLPSTAALSLGTSGCPLRCRFCQNWELSQSSPEDYRTTIRPPEQIAGAAVLNEARSVAFTYNEPTVFIEYVVDVAREARKRGLRSVMVSCGFMNEAPLTEMCDALDAIKIDLKGYSPSFYRSVCGAELGPVLRSIKQVARAGRHLEIVNLVVPTLNDSDASLSALAGWVAAELGPNVPLHFSRFHPDYQLLNLPPTPVGTLERARHIALDKGIHFAYIGNVPGHPGNHTYCPKCGKAIIKRSDFFVSEIHLKDGKCGYCGEPIPGVWA